MSDALRNPLAHSLRNLLLSGVAASAFLTGLLHSNGVYWSGQFSGLAAGLNGSFGRRANDAFGVNLAFWISFFAAALIIFAIVRFASSFSPANRVVEAITGVLAISAPLTCLWFVQSHRPDDLFSVSMWLRFEGSGAVVCTLLYGLNLWPISGRLTVALLTLHGLLWWHTYSVMFEFYNCFALTVPLLAYCAVLAWGLLHRTATTDTSPTNL